MHELIQLTLFSTCDEKAITTLLNVPHRRSIYKKGETIVHQGDPCRSLIALTEGVLETQMIGLEGREVTIERIEAPKILAPAFLFGSNNHFPVDVVTTTSCIVWHIDKEGFFCFMQQNPSVLRTFLQLISDRSQFLSQQVRMFAVESLRTRIISYITENKYLKNIQKSALILGVARPSLSRIISEMVEEGILEKSEHGFCLK